MEGCVITACCKHSTEEKWKHHCLRWVLSGIWCFLQAFFSDLLFHREAVLEDRPLLQQSVLDAHRKHKKAPEYIQLPYGRSQPQTRRHHMVEDGWCCLHPHKLSNVFTDKWGFWAISFLFLPTSGINMQAKDLTAVRKVAKLQGHIGAVY